MKRIFATALALCLLVSALAGCGGEPADATTPSSSTAQTTLQSTPIPQTTVQTTPQTTTDASAPPQSTAPDTTPPQSTTVGCGRAMLYLPFDQEEPEIYELPYTGELDASVLLAGMASLTGWNCDVTKVDRISDTARIDFALTALPFTYDTHTQNDIFFLPTYVDTVFLFLDSIARTMTENLGLAGVIFTQNGGEQLVLEQLYSAVELFPADTLYRGSAYYRALLLDCPYNNENGYPMLQLAGGMTLLYPNGFTVEVETDNELLVSAQDRVFITYRARELTAEALDVAKAQVEAWATYMTEVTSQAASGSGYQLDGKFGSDRFRVVGFLAPVKGMYYETIFQYDESVDFVDMEQIVADLSYALSRYN